MKAFKKTIIILSYFCYVAVILYILFALPMVAGYKPMPITDKHLGDEFSVGSMFYYHKVDNADMQKGYVAVYKNGTEKKTGIIYSNTEDGISIYQTGDFVLYENVLGINKTVNFPIIGYYYSYLQSHVALLVIIGVILALRIMFIYVDPEKLSEESKENKKETENKDAFAETFENAFGAKSEENKETDFASIFAPKPVEKNEEKLEEEIKKPAPEEFKIVEDSVKFNSNDVPLTSYINNLTFTTKDGYYNADEVDAALDKIVGRISSDITVPSNDKALEAEVEMLKSNKAEVEKECLSLRTEIENLKDSINEKDAIINENNKRIAEYKEMEQKVAKLLAAIKAGQIK